MDAESELPPPSSGLFLEVSFRRLLAKCESVVRGDANASSSTSASSSVRPELARDWATSPVFHHYVETLLEQLADLEGAAPAKRPSPEVLEAYKRRADLLSTMLRPPAAPPSYVLAFAGAGGKGAGRGGGDAAAPPASAAASAPEKNNDGLDDEARRAELLGPQSTTTSAAPSSVPPPALRPAAPPASLKGLAPATRDEIETQRGLQETLTDDLVGLARQLRANAEAAGSAVAERDKLLRVAETQLDGAVEGAKRSVAEVKAVYFANRRGFWATLLTFLMVGAAFTATFVYIRATSLLGFSSRKAAAASARRIAARAEAKAAKEAAAARQAAAATSSSGGVEAELEVAAAATEATETLSTTERASGGGADDVFLDAASASLDEAAPAAAAPDHTEL